MKPAAAWQKNPAPRRLPGRFPVLLMFLCCIIPGSAAEAQEAAPVAEEQRAAHREKPLVTDTITVTATKTRRDPVETPGEVNIIRREEIDRMQARSLDDVLRFQPGIEVGGGPRRLVEVPSIRGLSGSRVLATVDGVRLNYSSGHQGRLFLDVDALEQIEVVRGPNSALWGSGAVGGVLAMSTLDPADFLEDEDRMGGQLKLGIQGVSDEWLTGGMLVGRLAPNVEYLGSFTVRQGQEIGLGGGGRLENSAEALRSVLGKLIWRPARHTELRFSVQGFEEDGEVPTAPNVARTGPPSGLVDRQTTQMTYRLGYTLQNDENPYLRISGFAYHTTMDIRRRRLSDDRPDATRYDTTGFDLRNSSDLRPSQSHRHVLTYGLEYFHDRQGAEQDGHPYLLFPDADADTVSLYLQDEVSLGERVFLIPALRWDRFRNDTAGLDEVTNSQLSPKVGGVFRVTDFLYLEANYAEGFRSPAFQDLYISGTHFPGAIFLPNPELKPEKSRNVDVGLRLRSAGLLGDDDHVLFKFAFFRNRVDDFIDFNSTFNPATQQAELQFVNVQKAVIQGVEAELRWVFMTGLDAWASYTDIRGDDITGKNEEGDIPLEGIQPRKGIIGISYTHWPWDVTVGGRVQMVSGQDRVPDDVQETPGYSVYDLFATWQPHKGQLQGFRIDVGVDNLTDKAYRRHLASIPEAGINPKATISYARRW
jgi:hemoglobin/transferrin/lactoferrin receptor protein